MKLLLAVFLAVGLVGCGQHGKPNVVYMPDMVYSPAFKAQEAGAMRMPPKGTVPRDFSPYPVAFLKDPELAGRELKNPLQPTKSVLTRGQVMYETYCLPCHGTQGIGDGPVTGANPVTGAAKFPRPPSLHSDKVRGWTDGRIYHVISAGQNLMPSYATQILTGDRWAIIYYIRALQRAEKPTAADLKAASQQSK